MKKTFKIIASVLLWSIIIILLINGIRFLKVKLCGQENQWFIWAYILIGGLYSASVVIPTFLLIDYSIYIPNIKRKNILISLRLFTIFFLTGIVAIFEYFYF